MKKRGPMLLVSVLFVMLIPVGLAACGEQENAQTHTHEFSYCAAKDPTCTQEGNIEYWFCVGCGKYFTDAEGETETRNVTLPAQGHQWGEWQTEKPSNCKEQGVQARTCTVCGAKTQEDLPLSETHALTSHAAKDPTCTQVGNIGYWSCSVCGKLFEDANGTTEIRAADTVLPARHAYAERWEKDAEYHWKVCTACGLCSEKQPHSFSGRSCSVCGFGNAAEYLEFRPIDGGKGYEVTGDGSYHDNILFVPSEYNGLPVTSIGDSAFNYNTTAEKIILPSTVRQIGRLAFYECDNLIEVTLPDGLEKIGERAFADCDQLKGIVIPATTTEIAEDAFSDCGALESIEVEENNAVYYDEGNCLIERESATLVRGCGSSVIPNEVKIIGQHAFSGCLGLTEITIPGNVREVGAYAFVFCYNLTKVRFETGVQSIGMLCFQNCEKLSELYISDTVTEIGDRAFSYCGSLQKIEAAGGNPVYHSNGNCLIETASQTLLRGGSKSAIPADGSVRVIGSGAFERCVGLTEINIPNSVEIIRQNAFSGCAGLKNIRISASVTSIDAGVFGECSSLESIEVDPANTNYYSNGNCLIERASGTLLSGCKNSAIPADGSVKIIAEKAFGGCVGLTEIRIPEGVEEICWSAFGGCEQLKSVSLPESLHTSDGSAFSGCTNLQSVVLPKNLKTIPEFCFYGCTSLTDVYYRGTEEEWKEISVDPEGNSALSEANIHFNYEEQA